MVLYDWTPSGSRDEISGGYLNVLIFWTFNISFILDCGEINLHLLDEFTFLQRNDWEVTVFPD